MKEILGAILSGEATPRDFAALPVPDHYSGALVRSEDVGMFEGMASADKDPRKSLRVNEVPTPQLGAGEALVAVMASALNYNSVWSAIFEPLPTFGFLQRYGRFSERNQSGIPG